MENKLALADQSLSALCKGGNKFAKEAGLIFAAAVTKMALAKNIKLAEGTIGVWEECLLEDISKGAMDFQDFIAATKKIIRETEIYGRLDYANLYQVATLLCRDRRSKIPRVQADGTPMSEQVRDMIRKFAENLGKKGGESNGREMESL